MLLSNLSVAAVDDVIKVHACFAFTNSKPGATATLITFLYLSLSVFFFKSKSRFISEVFPLNNI